MTELFIVGKFEHSQIGAHLAAGADSLGISFKEFKIQDAFREGWIYRRLARRLLDDQPLNGFLFNRRLQEAMKSERPRWLLTTGKAPVFASTLALAAKLGVRTLNYSTDDPFNPVIANRWYHRALKEYSVHASPRRANLRQLSLHTEQEVIYVPFAYNEQQHFPIKSNDERPELGDVLFVGYGDSDRFAFFEPMVDAGLKPLLFGGGWNKNPKLRPFTKGFADLDTQRQLYTQIPISVCLVRRMNRDGHVMRTFEAPAMKACMLVEDTEEQREIFGEDEANVLFFSNPQEMVQQCKRLLMSPALRNKLRQNAFHHITTSGNTYTDRLKTMLEA